jgi:magnesium transporter
VDGTVSSVLSTEIPTCQTEDTAAAILERLVGRTWTSATAVYVLDGEALVGRIDLTDVLRSSGTTRASRLMERATARLHPDDDREHAIYLAIDRNRDEIPVVDSDGTFVGAVTSQTIIDTMHREHLEDALLGAGIEKMGLRIADLASASVRVAVRSRAPWLLVGLLIGLVLSVISSQFEGTLRETVALAFFLPVVAYIADSVGTQSEAIAVRAFAVTDVDYEFYLLRELLVGLIIGSMIGVLGGLGATFIAGSPRIGLVVGLTLFVSSAVATVSASLIPIGFIELGVDPALGSGPLATAFQDVVSIITYFLFAIALI